MDYKALNQYLLQLREDELPGPSRVSEETKRRISMGRPFEWPKNRAADIYYIIERHARFSEMLRHKHSYLEMLYVLRGSYTHTICGDRITIPAGSIGILAPDVEHKEMPLGMDDIAIRIMLDLNHLPPAIFYMLRQFPQMRDILAGNVPYIQIFCGTESRAQEFLMHLLQIWFMEPEQKRRLMAEPLLQLFMSEVLLGSVMPQDIYANLSVDENLEQILRYIQRNYATVSLTELAKEFGYTAPYLSKAIAKYCGMSFVEYRNRERLTAATALLLSSRYTIEDISRQCGFVSQSNFYVQFRKKYEVSPAEYRAHHQNQRFMECKDEA